MNNGSIAKTAVLYSDKAPTREQEERFVCFLQEKYGDSVSLIWKRADIHGGFRLEYGSHIYDWTISGRLEQLKNKLANVPGNIENIIPLIKETAINWTPQAIAEVFGTVISVGDGIATVSGLDNVTYGEILIFSSGIRGMVQDLHRNEIGCIIFGDEGEIFAGSTVKRTGRTAGISVGNEYIGRVVDALGSPIDGKGEIRAAGYRRIENPAPGIIDRQPVNKPLETGILAIDSMFPIGKGQRELIIGDRQTGKTSVALDTIINQKGKDVICIYVAIGQKASSVAQLVNTLKEYGAMEYSIVVNASASDSAPLQYIAPYSGCSLAEYFMELGRNVLIVYDDLSKHAIAYRSLSLLLERAPGREAYPGDVFFLHSRLLERSAQLSDEKGGGSITALPIVETQSGDVSAYIPTNIISITDGQLFLESELFFAGQRPAINVGLSVSRVGGNAQTDAMKKAAGTIRLDLAQYREMEIFTQFASDLDDATKKQLIYGSTLMQVLKQERFKPYSQHEQVIVLVTALGHLLTGLPQNDIKKALSGMLKHFSDNAPEVIERIENTNILDDETRQKILDIATDYLQKR